MFSHCTILHKVSKIIKILISWTTQFQVTYKDLNRAILSFLEREAVSRQTYPNSPLPPKWGEMESKTSEKYDFRVLVSGTHSFIKICFSVTTYRNNLQPLTSNFTWEKQQISIWRNVWQEISFLLFSNLLLNPVSHKHLGYTVFYISGRKNICQSLRLLVCGSVYYLFIVSSIELLHIKLLFNL